MPHVASYSITPSESGRKGPSPVVAASLTERVRSGSELAARVREVLHEGLTLVAQDLGVKLNHLTGYNTIERMRQQVSC